MARPWAPQATGNAAVDRELGAAAVTIDALRLLPTSQGFLAFDVARHEKTGQVDHRVPMHVWIGPATGKLVLPDAAAAGRNRAIVLVLINETAANLNVYAQSGQLIGGAGGVAVAANTFSFFISDGASRWNG